MRTNHIWLDALTQPLANTLGYVSARYEPWGGNPRYGARSVAAYDLTVKDPFVSHSDDWGFPTHQTSDASWLGRVHRGTPWQTIYLKSPGPGFATWLRWTGDNMLVTNQNGVTWDALITHPTNDWRVASLVGFLLNTNDLRTLRSVNQTSIPGWSGLLDGMAVLTNNLPDDQVPHGLAQFAWVIMSSDSPQASMIATALVTAHANQPDQYFRDVGDILAIPELSTASPWLNVSSGPQLQRGITDEAYEAIPAQLLPLLRPDWVGSVSQTGGILQFQFTGAEGYAYVVQTSSNLLDWTALITNYPANGFLNFLGTPPPGSPRRFYRSVLRP